MSRLFRWRMLLISVAVFAVLAMIAGERMWKPSRDNHYVLMAEGWLQGGADLEGTPPGHCSSKARARRECTHHTFDDYAALTRIELDDGSVLDAYPCRTQTCAERKREGFETWWVTGQGWTEFPRGTFHVRGERWFVSFPPGPALLMLPGVAAFGRGFLDVLLTALLASLIPLCLVSLLERLRPSAGIRSHLGWAAAWSFASPAMFVGAHGRVWFTAQIVASLATMASLLFGWRLRRPLLAGLCFGMAIASRPHLILGLVFFVWTARQARAPLRTMALFAAPVLLTLAALAIFNHVRFNDPFEFGHRFLEMRWQGRVQEIGAFSTAYLARNLECLLWLMPMWTGSAPLFKVSIHGCALWLASPWLIPSAFPRGKDPEVPGLIAAALLIAAVPLFYQNSGQLQFTYRFALDWLPFLMVALALRGGADRRWFQVLVLIGALIQGWGAWNFARAPGKLFVTDPMGWPFEEEFRS